MSAVVEFSVHQGDSPVNVDVPWLQNNFPLKVKTPEGLIYQPIDFDI